MTHRSVESRWQGMRGLLWLWATAGVLLLEGSASGSWIWIEGEKPVKSTMNRHPGWYDQVKNDQLSGGDLISNFHPTKAGESLYRVSIPKEGEYEFWVRANPVSARLWYRLDGGSWVAIDVIRKQEDAINIASDGKTDLRFLAWARAGKVALKAGDHTVRFRMDSAKSNHGYLDCFVLSDEPFHPHGALKPNQVASVLEDKGWFAFDPRPDRFLATSGIDLRSLNERAAGDEGFIAVKDGQFVHSKTGRVDRFWGVNGPASQDRAGLHTEARILAKRGVNLVRIHHGYFNERGDIDLEAVQHALDAVEALKREGIYSHFATYFPLWLTPKPDNPWLRGYNGKSHPFAALFFNKDFQKKYRAWWKSLLLTPGPHGKRLIDEPAVMGLELVNEDSYFFWTFNAESLPELELRLIETQFGAWLKVRYGSIDAAAKAWGSVKLARDAPDAGRMGLRPLWNMFSEKTQRDKDTARFLLDSQRGFYQETIQYLRGLGFRGLITASNWTTASPQVLGPLEKYSYTVGDFIDRHGYFSCKSQGEAAEWSVRVGHTYVERSALRFDPEEADKPKSFVHPSMDPSYDGKPSMISETTWNRPNRYRSEAPLFYAAYGALQDSDAIVHFADDSTTWGVKPGFFMQPWTLMSPAMMGQFPAAAAIYRKGLIKSGALLANLDLKVEDVLDLKGTPLPQDAAFDELRLKDVPRGTALQPGETIDPLIHFAGRTNVNFTEKGGPATLVDLAKYINHEAKTVTSTTGEVRLDYGKGVLTLNSPMVQGISGSLRDAGTVDLPDVAIVSNLELGHIVAVSLDDQPLATSRKILLQVMSEEKTSDFWSEPVGTGTRRIANLGHDPWLVKEIEGAVRIKRPDAATLRLTLLDFNGEPAKAYAGAGEFRLDPSTIYYMITP